MEEQREFSRFTTSLTVIYRGGGTASETTSRIVDISREGVGLSDLSPLGKDTDVELNIVVPGESAPIVALARSVWCRKTDDYRYRKGLRFTELYNDRDLKKVLNCVDARLG
ncbi:MAG: PilZ domain-containing protein [Candidatus Omnitrophota bacterium]